MEFSTLDSTSDRDQGHRAEIDVGKESRQVARGQYGLIARRQLLSIGATHRQVDGRLKSSVLVRMLPGVYRLGEEPITPEVRWMASVLAHPGSVLSHRSATALWELEHPRGATEVTGVHLQRPRTRPRPTYESNPPLLPEPLVHGTRDLPPGDITVRRGIPVTSVPRTLLDSASTATLRQLDALIDEALIRGLVSDQDLSVLPARTRGRRGGAKLRTAIEDVLIPEGTLRSRLESRMSRLCVDEHLPIPLTNQVVAGIEVDCLWPEQMLIVELDSRTHHEPGKNFEEDRERDARLELLGYRVLRLTWRMVMRDPKGSAAKVRAFLALGPPLLPKI